MIREDRAIYGFLGPSWVVIAMVPCNRKHWHHKCCTIKSTDDLRSGESLIGIEFVGVCDAICGNRGTYGKTTTICIGSPRVRYRAKAAR